MKKITIALLSLILFVSPVNAATYKKGDIIIGELTYYCADAKCNGKNAGKTASGRAIKNGVNPKVPIVACNWLPLETMIEINGKKYVVGDRGGKDFNTKGRLDVFTPEGHAAALKLGRTKNVKIKIVSMP